MSSPDITARQAYNYRMRDIQEILTSLSGSEFRRGIRLRQKELDYLNDKGLETVLKHAREFIEKRLAPAEPANDGRQTPRRNHPAFVAQHATATCCRTCLAKWHEIPKGRELTAAEKQYIVEVIRGWLLRSEVAVCGNDDEWAWADEVPVREALQIEGIDKVKS